MSERLKGWKTMAAAGAVTLALGVGGVAVAQSGGGGGGEGPGDSEGTLTGAQPDRATAAALKITGGGTANAVERDGEKGATWEVEITRPDGKTVDVRLDEHFKLVTVDGDSEAADTNDSGE